MYKSSEATDFNNLNSAVQWVLFPEGTKMGVREKAKSDAFAAAHNRPKFMKGER